MNEIEKKRVLVISHVPLGNAGVPRIMMDIYEGLKDQYHFDFLINATHAGYYDKRLLDNGSNIFYIGSDKEKTWKELQLFNFFTLNFRTFKLLKQNHYDIVHSHSGFASGYDMFNAWLCGVKKRVSHAHGNYVLKKKITNLYSIIGYILIKLFSNFKIGCSKLAGNSLFGKSSFSLVYNSIDLGQYKNVIKKEHDGLNFLQVGYYNPLKNQLFSVQLVQRLIAIGCKSHLFLIGFNGSEYQKKVCEYVTKYNLSDIVTFLPHDYDKFTLYPIIDYSLQPSTTEGFSLTCLEAQAAELKVVASDAVPDEVNMGLLKIISIDKPEQWVEYVCQPHPELALDKTRLVLFDRSFFTQKIFNLYES